MAGFKTHITTSTLLGMGYGAVGHLTYGIPLPSAVLAGGLCSVGGILPDVDSDHGHSLREVVSLLAAVIPMLLIERLRAFGLTHETIVLAAAMIYLVVRFGLTRFLRRYTVHRGMWHSIPAAVIAGLVAALLCSCPETDRRIFKVGGIVTGYLWHLVLDEIYATEWHKGKLRFKKSFGTALKMFSKNPWANISTYGKLVAVAALVTVDHPVGVREHSDELHNVGGQMSEETTPEQATYDAHMYPQQEIPPPQQAPYYNDPNLRVDPNDQRAPHTANESTPWFDPYAPVSR